MKPEEQILISNKVKSILPLFDRHRFKLSIIVLVIFFVMVVGVLLYWFVINDKSNDLPFTVQYEAQTENIELPGTFPVGVFGLGVTRLDSASLLVSKDGLDKTYLLLASGMMERDKLLTAIEEIILENEFILISKDMDLGRMIFSKQSEDLRETEQLIFYISKTDIGVKVEISYSIVLSQQAILN